jgi:hypothetical protein
MMDQLDRVWGLQKGFLNLLGKTAHSSSSGGSGGRSVFDNLTPNHCFDRPGPREGSTSSPQGTIIRKVCCRVVLPCTLRNGVVAKCRRAPAAQATNEGYAR